MYHVMRQNVHITFVADRPDDTNVRFFYFVSLKQTSWPEDVLSNLKRNLR